MAYPQVVKALVVDDDALIRRIYRAMLNGYGFEVTEVKDAKSAVNLFINQTEYDLVLMDDEMPEMDGFQATRIIKAMSDNAKIIAVADETSARAFLEAGVDAFLPKPLKYAELTAVLKIFGLLN